LYVPPEGERITPLDRALLVFGTRAAFVTGLLFGVADEPFAATVFLFLWALGETKL
jgi:hypothetical protein